MLKKIFIGLFAVTLVVVIGVSTYNVVSASAAVGSTYIMNRVGGCENGWSGSTIACTGDGSGLSVLDIPASDLNDQEVSALLYMREEEKLARDIYTKFYEMWGVATFQNIAASEQTHMDEIALLLNRYELADPAKVPGVFTNADLQALYDTLMVQGSQSISEALKAGGAIEEADILDLQTRLAQTDNADIQLVFNNLMNGSYHHLNAFSTALLNQTGEAYVPQSLPADLFQTITSGSAGNWNGFNNRQGYGTGICMSQSQTNTVRGNPSRQSTGQPTWAGGQGMRCGNP